VEANNTDCGIGVIKRVKKKQSLIEMLDRLTYEYIDSDRKRSIGLISVEEFIEMNL